MSQSPAPQPDPGPFASPLAFAWWFVGSAVTVAAVVLGARVLIELVVICSKGYFGMLLELATAWWTVAFVGTLVLMVAGVSGRPPLFAPGGGRARLVAVAVALVLLGWRLPRERATGAEPGFAAGPANATYPADENHPLRPEIVVTTNSFGLRDTEWAPSRSEGARRVVLIGDSYVWGAGIPEADGLLDRQLERAMSEALSGRRVEVLNVAFPGWGWFTYLDSAALALEAFSPDMIVIATLGPDDWHPLDYAQARSALGVRLSGWPGVGIVIGDLHGLSVRYQARLQDGAGLGRGRLGELLESRARRLAAMAHDRGVPVVIWEYRAHFEYLDRFSDLPGFVVLGWPDYFSTTGDQGWGGDPTLTIAGDGHPTSAGNALVAEILAPRLVELLSPGRSDSPPPDELQ